MILTYRPEGADRHVWTFRPRKLASAEAELIERNTGWSYAEFGVMFLKGSMLAYRAAIYAMLRADHRAGGAVDPGKWAEFSITADDVDVQFEPDEAAQLKAALAAADIDPDQRANLEALLDQAEEEATPPPPGASPFASPTPATPTSPSPSAAADGG